MGFFSVFFNSGAGDQSEDFDDYNDATDFAEEVGSNSVTEYVQDDVNGLEYYEVEYEYDDSWPDIDE